MTRVQTKDNGYGRKLKIFFPANFIMSDDTSSYMQTSLVPGIFIEAPSALLYGWGMPENMKYVFPCKHEMKNDDAEYNITLL